MPEQAKIQSIIQEKPRIFLIDLDSNIQIALKEKGLNVNAGSLGIPVEVPNNDEYSSHHCLLNFEIPNNLHEFDIVIIDLVRKKPRPYQVQEHENKYTQGSKKFRYISAYPETLFNPQPFGAFHISSEINHILKRNGILIFFASKFYSIEYQQTTIEYGKNINIKNIIHSNYSFYSDLNQFTNKSGKEIIIDETIGHFSELLRNYSENMTYEIIFQHPKTRDENNDLVFDQNFLPLIRNKDNEIISFCKCLENGLILVFPQIEDKISFLIDLLNNVLPSIYSSLFPYHTEFLWLSNKAYLLPHEAELQQKKEGLIQNYKADLIKCDDELSKNHEKFLCLHHLLTDSADALVKQVENFLKWLGFESIRNMDEINPKLKEEDLQVDINEGLLVVEIKGLGGTSTDSECSQISKIRFRRSEERGKFDVHALYIVNHQRFLPPLERENPPFKENQIRDAKNEKRGLLTTWQLFKLYHLIKDKIISKEEARENLIKTGLIEFHPSNCISFEYPEHIYQDGSIFIIKLKTSVALNEKLIVKRKDDYFSITILGLQIDGKEQNFVDSEKIVGIKTDFKVKKTDEILKKR